MKLHRLAPAIFAIALITLSAYGQEQKTVRIDNDGDLHLDRPVKIGASSVGRGMYHVSHVSINGRLVAIFRALPMPAGAKNMGPLRLGGEVGRLACEQRPLAILNGRSGLLIRKTGEKRWVVSALWFRNENYICLSPE